MEDIQKISSFLLLFVAQVLATPAVGVANQQGRILSVRQFPQTIESRSLSSADMNKFSANLYDLFSQRLANLSDTFNKKVETSESKILAELASLSEKVSILKEKVESPPVILDEIYEESGTIEFDGRDNSHLHRKIWIIGDDKHWFDVNFVLEENNLGPNSHLILWASWGAQHVYNGYDQNTKGSIFSYKSYSNVNSSQIDWEERKNFHGLIFLVTLVTKIIDPDAEPPRFKLRFDGTKHGSSYVHYREVMTRSGVQRVSYPSHNREDYALRSEFISVIAPPSPFNLTLKHLDVPGTPPNCKNVFDVLVLQDSASGPRYEKLPRSALRQCGREEEVSEFIGSSTVAIIKFNPSKDAKITGTGFAMNIVPSDYTPGVFH